MRFDYLVDVLTSVRNQEFLKIGGKRIKFYEGVVCRDIFKISPFWEFIEKNFSFTQKKDEVIDLTQGLVKLIMKTLYGVQIRKDINELYKC